MSCDQYRTDQESRPLFSNDLLADLTDEVYPLPTYADLAPLSIKDKKIVSFK